VLLLVVRSLHILAAFCYVGGLVGYVGMRVASAKASNLETTETLLALQHGFERFMLMPGGGLLVIFGLLTAWLEHWPRFALLGIALLLLAVPFAAISGPRAKRIDAALKEASHAGKVTDELRAAMHDKLLFACESVIVVLVFLILLVMLFKPG
jgi:Predicted integral membrane protein (DUF2269)